MYHLGWKMQTNVEEAVKMFLKSIWDLIKTGYLGSSADKESTCNAGDPNLSPGSVRSPGEGIGYPLQYCWASLVAQRVKNLPAMWETWVPSLSLEDPWRRKSLPTSLFLPGKFHGQRRLVAAVHAVSRRVRHNWTTKAFTFIILYASYFSRWRWFN